MKTIIQVLGLFCLTISLYGQQADFPPLVKVTPESVGFIQDSLDMIDDTIYNSPQPNFIGLMVIKDNKLAVEYYYHQYWRNHIHDIRSAGKSITAIMLGIAIKEGLVQDVNQYVSDFFPKEKYPDIHEDYKKIKLIHLLNMVSGLDANSDDNSTPGNAGKWIGRDEWVKYILSIPLAHEPGERWIYADINAVLIGAIIEEKSGMSLRDFAKEKVFDPLDIKEFYWYTNAANQTGGAGNLYLSALDFAKLGLLVANKGKWEDKQLADYEYMDRLLKEESPAIGNYNPLADGYGMLWYRSHRTFGKRKANYLWASGNGGNHLVIIPEENMVIAMTSSGYSLGLPHARAYYIVGKLINALKK